MKNFSKPNSIKLVSIVFLALMIASSSFGQKAQKDSKGKNTVPLEKAKLNGDETIQTPYGSIVLEHTYMTDESSKTLFDAMDFQRASQAYIWSTPLVSNTTWRKELDANYGTGKLGQFAILSSFNEKLGVVTANLTTPYIIQFADLSDGPIVIDYPAGETAGGVSDAWQRAFVDMGLTGPDEGKGGRYIIIPPGDNLKKYEKEDAYVAQSSTNVIFIGTRLLNPDPEFAKKFNATLKMGIYGKEMNDSEFKSGVDKVWSATAYRGLQYWKMLSDAINIEPVREQDKPWLAMLEPLGIKKGEPFQPDERQQKILLQGAAMGELMARNLQVNPRFAEPYWNNTSWYKSFDFNIQQETETKIQIDERATWYYEAVTSSKGMVTPEVGKGQVYMTSKRDSKGNLLRADKTYKLHVPKDVPVNQFWALTLYSENTRRPYENGAATLESANLDSRNENLNKNKDGSVDLYIGPKAPKDMERNFMKTIDKDGWFVYFRLYGPLEGFFDKTFSLPDFEIID